MERYNLFMLDLTYFFHIIIVIWFIFITLDHFSWFIKSTCDYNFAFRIHEDHFLSLHWICDKLFVWLFNESYSFFFKNQIFKFKVINIDKYTFWKSEISWVYLLSIHDNLTSGIESRDIFFHILFNFKLFLRRPITLLR